MRCIQIKGTPYERGMAHGTQLAAEIKRMVHTNSKTLTADMESFSLQMPSDVDLSNLLNTSISFTQEFAPDVVDELKGLADGAGLDLDKIVLLNSFIDLSVLCFEMFHNRLIPGCTCFAAASPATLDDGIYIGQNYDWSESFRSGVVLLRIESPPNPTALCFSIAGMLGLAGMNSAGLAIVINALTPRDICLGIPYTVVLRKALEQPDIANAIDVILKARRFSGVSYLLADRSGEILCLETTARDSEVLYALDGYLGHTNHYVHSRLAVYDADVPGAREGDSYVRWSRVNKMLRQRAGNIELHTLKEVACDHVGYPHSICNHPSTLASIIMDLQSLELWASLGNPCESPYTRFKL